VLTATRRDYSPGAVVSLDVLVLRPSLLRKQMLNRAHVVCHAEIDTGAVARAAFPAPLIRRSSVLETAFTNTTLRRRE
jgi:hypothetical protein